MKRDLTVVTAALCVFAVWALVVASSAGSAHAQPSQVALTASYSIIGGTGNGVEDVLTYVSGGLQQVVPLTGSPTVYMADNGSSWSAQSILTGSTPLERWVSGQDVSGTISSPLTVAFSYYNQYSVTFNFNVTNGGIGYTGPSVTFTQMGSGASAPVPVTVWVDASSAYSYSSQLPGSSSNERWILKTTGAGTVTKSGNIFETYDHEFLVSSSFSIVGGGAPQPPALTSTALGAPAELAMTSFTQQTWLDAGANYTFTSPLTSGSSRANETWAGTVLVKTQSGDVLSKDNNGTIIGPLSITPVYYHQFFVDVRFNFVGGNASALTAPAFTYQYFGNKTSLSKDAAVWVDSGTQYSIPVSLCCTASPSSERWLLYNSTSGEITAPTKIDPTYFHQYFEAFSYSVVGQQPPAPSGQPDLTYFVDGSPEHITLTLAAQTFWADANSTYSAVSTLAGSGNTERWFATLAIGLIGAPSSSSPVDLAYQQQYLLTVIGGGLPNQWVDAGSDSTISTPGVFGRSEGTGFRVVSYQIDSGSVVMVTKPTASLSITIDMNSPQTIQFESVTQFQVTLDQGAAGALASITPPTIQGDDYWYDSGSSVNVVLNGTWGRAHGVGYRITSISATAQPTIQVDTFGTVQAYNSSSLDSPVSITTTSATQYEVVLNGPALAAFSSISPSSSFANDTFWYNSGSPPVTVVLSGAYSRSAGTGTRTSSWQLDSGQVDKVAQTGPITIVTKGMNAPQFVNATSVVQYQVTFDKGASSALVTITNPSIPLDTGWYDASSPVGLVLKGVWDRTSGTGERLAGYSLNGGVETKVASTGQVDVLNLMAIASPESVTTTVVTQYQVTLDPGATASLSSITPTPIPNDNYWYDSGTSVSVSLNGVWGRTATSGERLVSYSLNQGAFSPVLSSSQVKVLSVPAVSAPQSITTKSAVQYHLTSTPLAWVSVTNSTIPGDSAGWFDAGTKVSATFDSVWNQTSAGSRESVVSYAISGGGKNSLTRSGNGTFMVTLSMTGAQSIALTSVKQYLLTVVGPPQVTGTPPSPTGDSYFDAGSKVTLTVPRAWNGTAGIGMRETLTSYALDGSTLVKVPASTAASFTTPAITFTQPQTLDFYAATGYQVEFSFFDGLGNAPVEPSTVVLGVGNSTIDVQGSSVLLGNGTSFTIVNITWEGASVGPTPPRSYQVKAAPMNVTVDVQAYPSSLKVVDLFGLPVSGAQVSMTLANGTVVTGTTNKAGTFSAGIIPVGTYTAKVTSLGTSVQVRGDAASGQSVAVGRVALSLILVFVVVAVAAAAGSTGFFMLRWSKRRKGKAGKVSEQK